MPLIDFNGFIWIWIEIVTNFGWSCGALFFFYFQKMTFLNFFDMYLIFVDINSQYLINIWSNLINMWSILVIFGATLEKEKLHFARGCRDSSCSLPLWVQEPSRIWTWVPGPLGNLKWFFLGHLFRNLELQWCKIM